MLKRIIIVLFSLVLALISFEFFLRYSPFEYGVSPVEYDKDVGMWHKKEFEGYTIKECYKTKFIFDKKGLPKNIYKYDKTKKDVIILGDSYIEAIMVKNENIIHNSLSKEFNQKYNFMNYGLSGTGPAQQFVILTNKVNLKNTKYIIHFINLESDLEDVDSKNLNSLARPKVYVEFHSLNNYRIIPPRAKNFYDIVMDLLGNYQIYFFIKKSLYYLKNNILSKNNKFVKKSIDEKIKNNLNKNWLYLKGAIYQINKYIKSIDRNIKYKIIIISENEKNKAILKNFLIKENIEFMFLNDIAKSMNIKLKSFKCDAHWNDETHQNIAKIIRNTNFLK